MYEKGRELEINTDASRAGLAAILMQKDDDGKLHSTYYCSHKRTPTEQNYSSYELEIFAIVRAV